MAEWHFILWIYHVWFTHLSAGGHLRLFHLLVMLFQIIYIISELRSYHMGILSFKYTED